MAGRPQLAIVDCEQIVTVCSNRQPYRIGADQDKLDSFQRTTAGIGCSIVIDDAGIILAIGNDDKVKQELTAKFGPACLVGVKVIDGQGCSVIPGLIDAHTHPVWAGDRVDEFDRKLRGATYMDIHNSGGGIHFTVRKTKEATEDVLLSHLQSRIAQMVSCGTTVLECKSGYGLELETEMKMLKVIERARQSSPIELVSTFLGAHSVPKNMAPEDGVRNVLAMLDSLGPHADRLHIEFVDVFCEKGVYDIEQTRTILEHAHKVLPNTSAAFHGDELCDLNGGALAAELKARSLSHLEFTNTESISAMAKSKVAGILCPTTCYLLKLRPPAARQMIESGVPVVIATDYNPNAMCYSLPMAMNLAAVKFGLTLNECLVGTTINAAYALKREASVGSLEVGKRGDCLLLNAPDWRHLVYQFGNTSTLIHSVIKAGRIIQSTASN